MRVVRYLLRVSALMVVGVAVFCGLVLLLNAQILLNRYAELHMMDTDASAPIRRADAADNGPALPPVTDESTRTGGAAISEPPAASADNERAAIHIGDAERIADAAAADRWVDVILTHQPATAAAFSEVVLENVKVLAIEPIGGNVGERPAVHAVTLDVDSETVENLLLASRSGTLSLALHRPADKHPVEARHNGNTTPTQSLPLPPAAAVRQTADVEVAAGAAVSVSDAPPAALPDVAAIPPIAGSESPPAGGPDLASIVPSSSADAPPAARTEVAHTPVADAPPADMPTAEAGDEYFTVVTVNRVGGPSSMHRVPRER